MATNNQLLLTSGFTSQDSITITHNLDRLNLDYRVIVDSVSRPDLVNDVDFTSGDERNEFTINLKSSNTGSIQVLDTDRYPTNLPSPESNVKLVNLPPASGITDSYVTGATLNSNTLELSRNQGLSTLTADLSSIDGTVTRVAGGGTVNGLTLSGSVTDDGELTLGGTLAINNSDWSGTDLSIANGGTGVSTSQDAINELTQVGSATNEYVLTKDTSTGNALWKVGGGADTNTYVTGFTYDDINTFTITDNDGSSFTSSISVLSATTISGGTFYGDGSNLTLPTLNMTPTYFRGTSTSTADYNGATPTAVPWDGSNVKTDGITHSTSTTPSRVYVDNTGIYDLYSSIYYTCTSNSRAQIKITVWVNGSEITTVGDGQGGYARRSGGANNGMSHISTLLELEAGNHIEIKGEIDGAAANTVMIANQSILKLIRLDNPFTGLQGQKGDTGTVTNNSGMRSDSFSGLTTTATFHGDGTDLGLQHDRQSVSDTVTATNYGSGWGDIPNLTLDTGNLGTVGDYIISFDCTFDNNTKDTENKIRLSVGGDATILTDSVRIQYINDKENNDEYSFSTSAFGENISAGTTIKAQFANSGGSVEIWGATLTIDGIRTTNNIS